MNRSMHNNGNYTVGRNGIIALEGDKTESIDLLLQGRIEIYAAPSGKAGLEYSGYRLFGVDQNIFIGVNDIFTDGKYGFTFKATSDCSLFAHEAGSAQDVLALIRNQKDYGTYIINSISILIDNSFKTLQKLRQYCLSISDMCRNLCTYHAFLAQEYRLDPAPGKVAEIGRSGLDSARNGNMFISPVFSRQFIETGRSVRKEIFPADSPARRQAEYYTRLLDIPAEYKKQYFTSDYFIASCHIEDSSACLAQILESLRTTLRELDDNINLLCGNDGGNIYAAFVRAAKGMAASGLDPSPAVDAASYIVNKLNDISGYLELEYRHEAAIDRDYIKHAHSCFISSLAPSTVHEDGSAISVIDDRSPALPDELTGSAAKILEYSQLPEEEATRFLSNLTAFRNLGDRLSLAEPARSIRSAVADQYFEVYSAVFRRACNQKDDSRLIKMFLLFGYMDERLLDNSQTMAVYRLAGTERQEAQDGIYHMNSWLEKIYLMGKDPSVNSFGHDYFDTFREMKKLGKVSEKDKPGYIGDREGRLAYEINNMFRTNHRLCHGQITFYFPILHRDMAPYDPARSYARPSAIREKLDRILGIDYSAFHRDIHYRNPDMGIEKEIISVQVRPDIILVPVYGTRAMMWQEITGKLRNSPARFILPVFTDENLDEMLVKLVGNFRWELCRTMMGTAWNNPAQPSLTSEYSDYIQFYRKNRELSEEAKMKVKALCTKYHNKLRDIFTSDYETWINSESKGNQRLNKIARSIFFKYCPFSKEIMEQLEKLPVYAEQAAAAKFQRARYARELENRYKSYIKANGELDPALRKNLEFYRDN